MLNPVRAGMVVRAEDWTWSSYRASVGLEASPGFLTTDWVLSSFGEKRRKAKQAFARFVAEGAGKESPWKALKGQIYLGSEGFVEQTQARIDPDRALEQVPVQQKRPPAGSLAYYAEFYGGRDRAMAEAYRSGAYSM